MEKQKIQTTEFLKSVFEEMHSDAAREKTASEKTWLILCDESMLNVAIKDEILDQESQMGPVRRWRMKKDDNLDLLFFPEGNWTNSIYNRIFNQPNPQTVIIFHPLFLTKKTLDFEEDFFSQIFEITEFCKINLELKKIDSSIKNPYSTTASKICVCQPDKSLQLFIIKNGWNYTNQSNVVTNNTSFSNNNKGTNTIHLGFLLGIVDKQGKKIESLEICLNNFQDFLNTV